MDQSNTGQGDKFNPNASPPDQTSNSCLQTEPKVGGTVNQVVDQADHKEAEGSQHQSGHLVQLGWGKWGTSGLPAQVEGEQGAETNRDAA